MSPYTRDDEGGGRGQIALTQVQQRQAVAERNLRQAVAERRLRQRGVSSRHPAVLRAVEALRKSPSEVA